MNKIDKSWWYLSPAKRRTGASDTPPPPPYHLQACQFLLVDVVFTDEAVRAVLPNTLTPTPGRTGGFGLVIAEGGWGIAPYSGSFAWIDVESHDSSDGAKARFHAGGYLSGLCGLAFQRYMRNARIEIGQGKIRRHGARLDGASGGSDGDVLQIAANTVGEPISGFAGVNYYIHADANERLCVNSAAYGLTLWVCDPTSIRLALGAVSGPFSKLVAEQVLRAGYFIGSHTLSEPKSLATRPGEVGDEEAARMIVLNIFSQLGRAAILIRKDRRVILATEAARLLLGDALAIVGGKLTTGRRQEQRALDQIVTTAIEGYPDRLAMPVIALSPGTDGQRLLVQALPVPSHSDAPAAVILLTAPGLPAVTDVTPSLQLLGLTPAEARAAVSVGAGLSHREAAEQMGISEGTVRVTLSQVYGKLGLKRVSELAGLVNRLGAVSARAP